MKQFMLPEYVFLDICGYLWTFFDSSHRLYTIQPLYNPSGGDHFNISVKYERQELFLAVELLNRVPEKMLKKM